MVNFFNNKKGSAVLVIVFLALMGFFAITLLASDVIKSNLIMSKTQLNSTKAYFAAEVGLEQALYSVMRGEYELPDASKKNVFSALDSGNGVYNVDYNRSNSIRTFVSTGGYLTEHRSTEVSFCIPDCFEKDCDASDGCDGYCPSTCTTDVGCRNSQLADSIEVDGSGGSCCDGGKCYECSEGYVWDGSACIYDCVQQCEGLSCGEFDPNCHRACPGSCDSDPGCVAGAAPGGTVVSPGASCCDIAGTSYTCYECAAGYGWNGSACVACDANVGLPYPGGSSCFDAGIYDCFGHQVLPTEQIAKGTSCAGGNDPQVALGMNEGVGVIAYDSTVNNNDGVFQGNDWPYRKEIIIDHSKFTLDLIDFQFLLDIKDLGLFYRAQDDGDDIVFRDASGNIIPHEIEYFQSTVVDANMGRLIAWLRIPQLYAAQDTVIYMYYGNPTVGSQQKKTAVWKEYKGVWHLNNNLDSSPSAANISWGGFGVWRSTVASSVYQGVQTVVSYYTNYGYGSAYMTGGSLITLNDTTVSAWVKPSNSSFSNNWLFVTNTVYMYSIRGQGMFFSGNRPFFSSDTTTLSSGRNLADGNWHHIAYVVKDAPGTCYFYVDGEITASGTNCYGISPYGYYTGASVNALILGTPYYPNTSPSNGEYSYVGTSDELRFAFYPFDSNYIKVSYQNQQDPASYIKSIGVEQSLPGGLANWVPSIYDQALEFNGSSNYLSFANGTAIPLNGNMTLEAWVYPSFYGEVREIASKWGDSWGWYINNFNQQCFYLKRSNSTTPYVCNATLVPANAWTHLGVVYNKSGNQVIFYSNGVASAPIALASLAQGTTGSLEIAGADLFSSYAGGGAVNASRFSGRIDEFKAYDYVRTATQIQYDANKNVCNGDGGCVALSSPVNNTGTYQSCNDICYGDGKVCSSVGTDSAGTNGLMSVYNAGYCGTFTADCSTTIVRNPEEATPFLCNGYQTNWTNCNCTICDINFGSPCTGNVCIKPNTGITACDGTCDKPEFVTAGTSCGDNRECDGLGECRNVCHPLIGKPCGEDGCNNPGIVDCEGFCIGSTPKTDGINCENTANDPLVDQCWGGTCTQCVEELGDPCNVGECLDAGTIDCFGGCTACEGGDCIANPNYAADNKPCDSGYGLNTGTCDSSGVCEPCDDDYLNLGPDCNTVPCYDAGLRDCETGICPTAALLPVNTYCTTLGGDPGACTATGECTLCASGYMDACNNSTPCHRAGTKMCDGTTCTTSGYLDEGDSCNAGHADNWAYPDTGYCNASHSCIACVSGYLNEEECNDGPCQIAGNYLCDGGCDACIDNDCTTNPRNLDDGDTCDTGAPTAQPYSGTCESGVCNSCATGFLAGDDCNTAECHEVGKVECDGDCSTGTDLADVGTECDGGVYDGYPGRDTGSCDATGDCDTCNWYYIYNQPCKPSTGDLECWEFGTVATCQGACNSAPKTLGTTCSVDGFASTLPYTGKCDGEGRCNICDSRYINRTACNNEVCHVPSTYSCEGTCLSVAVYNPGTFCNAGFYPSSTKNPNTGQCGGTYYPLAGNGICTACNIDYLNNTPCYPVGVTEANKPCYNPQTVTTCYGTCPVSYKGAGIPCGGGNECNGAGVCTTPLATIVVQNFQTDKSCQTVCASSPYVGRGCIDMGFDSYGYGSGTNNYYMSWYLGYGQLGTCSTVMSSYYDKRYGTYCTCGNCVPTYGEVCKVEDQCNYQSTYPCDGICPANYKAQNLFCDPVGTNPNGYCYSGSCLPCTQVPGDACNEGVCRNQGVYNCQGDCSTASNLYKPVGTVCLGTGVCDGAGACVTPSPKYNTACPYPPRDSECYISGTWNYDGTVCLNTSIINNNAVCYTDAGKEGRCSLGYCNACNDKYNTDCPVNSPYNAYCYYAGKYECNGTTCVGPYYKNNGSSGCGTESYICDSGKCVVGVVGQIYLNVASGKSCDQICMEHGYHCFSVGFDSLGNDDNFYIWKQIKDASGNYYWMCDTSTASCSSVMSNTGGSCGGHTTNWTNCNCTNCSANAFTSCQSDPMYTGLNYDSECYNFGTYDCDGTCLGNGTINNGGVCSNNSTGLEGRCNSGVCNQCASSYLNGELCTPGSCATFVRECNGDCSTATTLGVGETCGVGSECTEAGVCVPASSLPDIVVSNFATGQSCNSICSNYPDRTCESIGTDGTQAGGTNGKGNYYGLVDESPACVSQNSYCSTIFSRSPSLTTNPYYGYTCNGTLSDWTYCRCTNQ